MTRDIRAERGYGSDCLLARGDHLFGKAPSDAKNVGRDRSCI
jgi:hypothetical protein